MQLLSENVTTDSLEQLLANSEPDAFIEFSPSNRFQPGLFALFLQVLCSKLRTNSDFAINTNIKLSDEEEILTKFYNYYHLLSIILFKNNLVIRDINGFMLHRDLLISHSQLQFNLQEELYSRTFENEEVSSKNSPIYKIHQLRKRIFSDRSSTKLHEGVSFFIPCFDHNKLLKSSSYFYNKDGFLRSKEEVVSWVSKLFKYNNLNIRAGIERNNTHNDVGLLIKELFDNTEEWAKTTHNNKARYLPNLRGCFVNIFMEGRLQQDLNDGDNAFQQYIRSIIKTNIEDLRIPNWQSEMYSSTKVGICEVSILDTGPGMARRWLANDYGEFDIRDEKIAVTKCFNKYLTSDQTGRSQVRGRGLDSVIRVIGNNGFIFVRTGRLSLCRNFFRDRLNQNEIEKGLNFDFDIKEKIEGTTITILYPFLYNL